MDDLFLVKAVSETRVLCLSPLSRKTYREADGQGLGGDGGYFIYEAEALKIDAGIEILAKAKSAEAGRRIFDLMGKDACSLCGDQTRTVVQCAIECRDRKRPEWWLRTHGDRA